MGKNRKDVIHMLRNQKGFTLMELMIVIVIIGVLAAIGVPAYKGYTVKAKEAACKAQRRTVQTAVGMYYADRDAYPGALDAANLGGYIDNIAGLAKCPADGTTGYTLVDGVVTCSKHP